MALTQVQGGMILPSTTLTTPIVATTMGVGGATPATSGAGITFPATQSASSDANTLDDYEEGTWTPTTAGLTVNSGSVTWTGKYTKVGRLVTVNFVTNGTFNITFSANSTRITNLPFTNDAVISDWGVWGNTSTTAASYGLQCAYANSLYFAATVSNTANQFSGTVTYTTAT
jgi:hypothetical protein